MIRAPIADLPLERHLSGLSPDGVTWFALGSGRIQARAILINGTRAICQARANHGLGPVETMLLGKGLLGAGLLAATLSKESGQVNMRVDGSGPAEGMSAGGIYDQSAIMVRGRLFANPLPEDALALDSPSKLFGSGALTVTRTEEGASPFSGSIPMKSGDLAKDLSSYFLESEQIRSAVDIGIFFDQEGRPKGAGALLIQALPGADDGFLARVEDTLPSLPPLGLWFSERGTRDELIPAIFGTLKPERTREADFSFGCPCSRERFLDRLKGLDARSKTDILSSGPWPLVTVCHYCASSYSYEREEIERTFLKSPRPDDAADAGNISEERP